MPPRDSRHAKTPQGMFSFDLDGNAQHDILHDPTFEVLLRLAWSGLVKFVMIAPPCKEYSRLKLKPGGPRPLCTPKFMQGVPNLPPHLQQRVRDSSEIHARGRAIFEAVVAKGGIAILEQPPSSMAWLEPENLAMLQQCHAHMAWVAACHHHLDIAKSWSSASNCPKIQQLAAQCGHAKPHPSFAGVKVNGVWASTLTAEYPPSLAMAIAQVGEHKVSPSDLKPTPLPLPGDYAPQDSLTPTLHACRLRVCDGAGMHSTADWSIPHPSHPLQPVAQAWLQWAKNNDAVPRIVAHIGQARPEPPLSQAEGIECAMLAFKALNSAPPECWEPNPGQPYRLRLLQAMGVASSAAAAGNRRADRGHLTVATQLSVAPQGQLRKRSTAF